MKSIISENWNKFLLKEAMRTPNELPDDVYILIDDIADGDNVSFIYVDNDGNQLREGDDVYGILEITKDFVGGCHGAWSIFFAKSAQGWGPLLYDVAMEWTTMRRSGLMADRTGVSDKAYEVWAHYMNNRSDVEKIQLDNLNNDLTPEERDNCVQKSSESHGNRLDIEWHKTPTSKVYKKNDPTMIRTLQSMDKLIFGDDGY